MTIRWSLHDLCFFCGHRMDCYCAVFALDNTRKCLRLQQHKKHTCRVKRRSRKTGSWYAASATLCYQPANPCVTMFCGLYNLGSRPQIMQAYLERIRHILLAVFRYVTSGKYAYPQLHLHCNVVSFFFFLKKHCYPHPQLQFSFVFQLPVTYTTFLLFSAKPQCPVVVFLLRFFHLPAHVFPLVISITATQWIIAQFRCSNALPMRNTWCHFDLNAFQGPLPIKSSLLLL